MVVVEEDEDWLKVEAEEWVIVPKEGCDILDIL